MRPPKKILSVDPSDIYNMTCFGDDFKDTFCPLFDIQGSSSSFGDGHFLSAHIWSIDQNLLSYDK